MPLGTSDQDVCLFQPGSLIPKASPVTSEGEEEGFFSRGGALKHLSEVTDFEEPNLLERTQTPHPHSSMDQPDVELKTKILSHEANLKPGQFAS